MTLLASSYTRDNAVWCHKLGEDVKQAMAKGHINTNACLEDIFENNIISQGLKWIVGPVYLYSFPYLSSLSSSLPPSIAGPAPVPLHKSWGT